MCADTNMILDIILILSLLPLLCLTFVMMLDELPRRRRITHDEVDKILERLTANCTNTVSGSNLDEIMAKINKEKKQ